jgi:hypothetical protein
MGRVVIGVDPHKRSATIEVLDERERVLQVARFGTDQDGYRALRAAGRQYAERVGRSRAAPVWAGTSLSASSRTANVWSMCRRSCPRGRGLSGPTRPSVVAGL